MIRRMVVRISSIDSSDGDFASDIRVDHYAGISAAKLRKSAAICQRDGGVYSLSPPLKPISLSFTDL